MRVPPVQCWPERAFHQGRAAEPATWHCRAKALCHGNCVEQFDDREAASFALFSLGTGATHSMTELGTPSSPCPTLASTAKPLSSGIRCYFLVRVVGGSHFALGIP